MAGFNHIAKRSMYTQYAASKKVPAPAAAVIGTGVMLLLGGISVLLGIYPMIGLCILAAFLAGVTPFMHNFWAVSEPNQKAMELVQFTKNIALLGATLMMIVFSSLFGPWPFRMVQ